MKEVVVIGVGMGNSNTLTIEAKNCVENAEVLIGAKRMTDLFEDTNKPIFNAYESNAIAEYIANTHYSNYAVLMSGDTGFYSGANKLVPLIQHYTIKVIPGISSISYFCAKLLCNWEDAYIISLHGRVENIVLAVKNHKKTFALTDGKISGICSKLSVAGLGTVEVIVGENLSYNNEKIVRATADELIGQEFAPISVILINNHDFKSEYSVGIDDDAFIRGKVPMTKSEVRVITMSKLKLKHDSIAYDIGAGTGSVAIEMASIANRGKVYAIEQNIEAIKLIYLNKQKFAADNLEIVEGLAPEVLEGLPIPDVVFIGGSKGNMEQIVNTILNKNNGVRIVVNAIAIETLTETLHIFKTLQLLDIEIVQVAISKTKQVGNYNMLTGQNPVFIVSARGNGYEAYK